MYSYYDLYRNSKDHIRYRLDMIRYAQKHGIKPTARHFQTTQGTVRKWVRRFEAEKRPGLVDRSKRPKTSPNIIKPYWYFKIADVCKKA
ncbi:MAG: helix-turn-helix domain containing protein [Spirochaetales bacterium]|nr:helix-turn-helix domain containing protein [Spirochaetales bacterium]MCF7939926.1 helix-turn-helix domain containing protein [Spirochaetales bacterium]